MRDSFCLSLSYLVFSLGCGSSDDSNADATTVISTATGSEGTGDGSTTDGESSGSTSDTGDSSDTSTGSDTTSDATDTGPSLDIGTGGTAETTGGDCLECSLSVSSMQSGVLEINGADVLGTAELMNEIVYVVGSYGAGRFIAVADSSIPMNETTDCPLYPWLAGTTTPDPAMLVFGWTSSDGPVYWSAPNQTVSDIHMPTQYIGDPAALAADFDIVLYLESSHQHDQGDAPSDAEMQTLLDYVYDHGGGLYISSEFSSSGGFYLNAADRESVNRLFNPLGLNQPEFSLNWGDVSGGIEFECFPPVD